MKKVLFLVIIGSLFLTFHQAAAVTDPGSDLATRIAEFNQKIGKEGVTKENKETFDKLYQDSQFFYREFRDKYRDAFNKLPPEQQKELRTIRDFLEWWARILYKPFYTHSPELPPGVMPILAMILGGMVLGLRRLFSRRE